MRVSTNILLPQQIYSLLHFLLKRVMPIPSAPPALVPLSPSSSSSVPTPIPLSHSFCEGRSGEGKGRVGEEEEEAPAGGFPTKSKNKGNQEQLVLCRELLRFPMKSFVFYKKKVLFLWGAEGPDLPFPQ